MDRIFYKSDTVDAYTGNPIYVFDTSHLPPTDSIDYDLFVPTMMRSLPKHPYVVIMFSGGLNKILWIWGVKFLKSFLADSGEHANVENLQKVIAVHESWFVKSITQILTNFSFSKNTLARLNSLFDSRKHDKNLLTSCDSLSELSGYVDITRLKLSLNIYKHDAGVTMTPTIDMQFPVEPIITSATTYSARSDPIFFHHFYQLFHIVELYAHKVEMLFHKPGNRLNTDILFMCMLRNQLLWINDWDLYCIASCFKKILLEVSLPLLPVDKITLPMRDDTDYLVVVLNNIFASGASTGADTVLFQVLELCRKIVDHNQTTRHTYVTILRSMCHALTHEINSQTHKDRIAVGVRFIKNLLVNWHELRVLYAKRFRSVSAIINGEDLHDATIDELYNMSHDITIDGIDSIEEESGPNSDLLSSISEEANSVESSYWLRNTSRVSENSSRHSLELEVSQKGKKREIERADGAGGRCLESQGLDKPSSKDIAETLTEISLNDLAESLPHKGTDKVKNSTNNSDPASTQSHTNKFNVSKQSSGSKSAPKKLNDVSNVQLQFPPQKYKFERSADKNEQIAPEQIAQEQIPVFKRPVVRGRKVGELTKLFEERFQAMDLLRTI